MTKFRLVRATSLRVAVSVSAAISASVPVTISVPVAWRGGRLAWRGSRLLAVFRVRRRGGLAYPAAGRTGAGIAGMRDRGTVRRHLPGRARRVDQVAEGRGPLAGVGVLIGVAQSIGGAVPVRWHDLMAGALRT